MTLFAASFVWLAAAMLAVWALRARWRSLVTAGCVLTAAALVAATAVDVIASGTTVSVTLGPLAILGPLVLVLSPLRALFMLITAIVFAASIAFAVRDAEGYPPARAALFITLVALLFAAMLAVFAAGDIVGFVFAWEIMSLALWGLVSFDQRRAQTRRAGLVTIALSEAGALAGLAGLLVLAAAAGSPRFADIAQAVPQLPAPVLWSGFALTFFGFGVKTGIMPVNVWMAEAYAAAPRSVTPLFSGATLNLGVFALWIIDAPLAAHATWMALIVLTTGALTALLGIVYALVARDLTRLLTHSSIENLGIVVAALGAGFAFIALGKPALGGIALIAGLYHMLNHSMFKTLLFLGAGAIDAATGTREMDRLGGLARRLPLLGTLFLIGTLAIAALPPLNGFVSEWLTLQALLRVVEIPAVPIRIAFAISGALLALAVGLAVTCFTMLAGSTLLGLPRSAQAAKPVRLATLTAVVPMTILAAICLSLGVLATGVIPILSTLAQPLAGVDTTAALVPAFFQFSPAAPHGVNPDLVHALTPLGAQLGRDIIPLRGLIVLHSGTGTPVVFAMSAALTFAVLGFILALVWLAARAWRRRAVVRRRAWEAGLYRLYPEMSYTASAFAAPVRVVFDRLLRPVVSEQTERHGAFTTAIHRRLEIVHVVDRLTLTPLIGWAHRVAALLARMHHGRVTFYASYVLAVLIGALVIARAALG
ncbi:MAG: hypothetical protein L0H73_07165 [Nitrococcus sp.]|nr:hypothetical protein [Nitrococcus sp.]